MNRAQTVSSITDLAPGAQVPVLARTITPLDLVKYCGASDDYAQQHWDHLYMVEHGFPGVIVHGWFTFGVMCQAVTNWIPREIADVSHYGVRYHRTTLPGELSCGGEITEITRQDGKARADLKLWARDGEGALTTTASMTLTFA